MLKETANSWRHLETGQNTWLFHSKDCKPCWIGWEKSAITRMNYLSISSPSQGKFWTAKCSLHRKVYYRSLRAVKLHMLHFQNACSVSPLLALTKTKYGKIFLKKKTKKKTATSLRAVRTFTQMRLFFFLEMFCRFAAYCSSLSDVVKMSTVCAVHSQGPLTLPGRRHRFFSSLPSSKSSQKAS